MLVFLKLGGSLITNKDTPRSARPDVLARLMGEVAEAQAARPALRLLLGHGSGSFGHVEGKRHGTRAGVHTESQWRGYAEVQHVAGLLNRLVVDGARAAGLPVVNFPPSASAVCRDGVIQSFALDPLQKALDHGLLPLVFGDVALDEVRGGTIVSTEEVFRYLAGHLRPQRILLAGIEPGVLTRWPQGEVIPEITARSAVAEIGEAGAADVTGGMASKVSETYEMVASLPGVEALIFSGAQSGAVRAALLGEPVRGTIVRGP